MLTYCNIGDNDFSPNATKSYLTALFCHCLKLLLYIYFYGNKIALIAKMI